MQLNELNIIQKSISSNVYIPVETNRIELKDLSNSGDWKELYKTVCAFLNTEGGIIIIGIKEKVNQEYILTGYDPNAEPKIKQLKNLFTDENNTLLDLSASFPSAQVINFINKQICIVYVEKLPVNQRFVYYKSKAYKRNITGDHVISAYEIQKQRELKEELAFARELDKVANSKLENLDVDKLNEYIFHLNTRVKIESHKPNIEDATSFLVRKSMLRDGVPTYLGMLVCGKNIEDVLGKLCEVDGYVDIPGSQLITQNKQVINDNIIPLMQRSIKFIYSNIQVGVSFIKGGQEQPEYPEKLIRETLNNALAHRSYTIDHFTLIIIRPNKSIEIKNPGNFRAEQLLLIETPLEKIKRIIPIPKPRNPRLADVLKVFDRWESKGTGMASLTNACLNNEIDLPYYKLPSKDSISLVIPKGRLLDEQIEYWLSTFSKHIFLKNEGRELSKEEKLVLAYFYKSEKANNTNRYTILLTADNNHFQAIDKLEKCALIYCHPNSPDLHPVYLVDRVLIKDTYNTELRRLFGGEYDDLPNDYKDILDIIYQYNKFSLQETVSANATGNFLYRKQYSIIQDIKAFESFKRGIRYRFNKLEEKKFIRRKDGEQPLFIINEEFDRTPSLFDN